MAPNRHATPFINHNMFIFVLVSLLLPMANECTPKMYDDGRGSDKEELRLTREYHLRQGALRGFIVKPSRQYDLQLVEIFLGIPYAGPPVGSLRFMPPISAPPWSGLKMATSFAPVCPQSLPVFKKVNPPSLGRQHYMSRLKTFLTNESEDCLYLNIYVPYREQKSKKFPILVFIHGDSFEWSSGNPYDGRILSSYGNIMVITVNYRLGVFGFLKPSLTNHDYGNNGLFDQFAALQWIKDNIEDLNGDPRSVTLMGHGTGAACVNFLMLSPIPNDLFRRAILMSGSALSDWSKTKHPMQYTVQVAQSLGCKPNSDNMMTCLQNKTVSEIKKVQLLAREFETPLGPTIGGPFMEDDPTKLMKFFPNLLSKYQLLSGVTELESYHKFGVIELDHGVLENQRDEFITKYVKVVYGGAEDVALREILKRYSPINLDPQRWSVEANRDVILDLFSDARTLSPLINFTSYQSRANMQTYFYVFGHNSVSTDYAQLNKSVHGEELPYVLGVPLGGTNTHFHADYTPREKLLSEVIMRLWTNFVKNGKPNTQSVNEYYTLDKKYWNRYNVEWPEYNDEHQSYLKLDIPPSINSLYRSNYTKFWMEELPVKMSKYIIDPLMEFTPVPTKKTKIINRNKEESIRRTRPSQVVDTSHHSSTSYGRMKYFPEQRPDTSDKYREVPSQNSPTRSTPPSIIHTTTAKPANNMPIKTSSATITLIISLGILFLAVNVGICAILYLKKRKLRLRERVLDNSRHSRAEIGEVDIIGQKSSKDDKSALKTFKNGCSVIKSMSINKMRQSGSKNVKKKPEPCKTPKSDDSGGFRERFQLRRHLSTSTLDAHTKVRDWIVNEVMHRCSPGILRKSNTELDDKHLNVVKPFTRSEELLSDSIRLKKDTLKVSDALNSKLHNKIKTSEKTTSTSALGSHSSIGSNKISLTSTPRQTGRSNDSLRSKGTESVKSKKVSVAIDATPAARTSSILKQEPIEISKSFELNEEKHSKNETKLQRSKTEGNFKDNITQTKDDSNENKIYTNVVTLSLRQDKPLKISHKHSTSDPVTDVNYDKTVNKTGEQVIDILPPVTFRNDINVTSRDENVQVQPMSVEDALLTIKRRNFPKVLPDLPKSQKRLSLQPTSLQSFRSYTGSIESPSSDRPKVPPQPPPRTTTLERRLAYKNSKPLSSFDVSNIKKIPERQSSKNYENIDSLTSYLDLSKSLNRPAEPNIVSEKSEAELVIAPKEREYPKFIIASSHPATPEPKIVIKPSPSQIEIPANIPRVRLPDDFHSYTSGSVTSYSSYCSDDDDDEIEEDFIDDIAEDKLIKELVGGVDSPTNLDDVLDSKGPETIFEKKLEIVPVKINASHIAPKSQENYVCITDLLLPDVSDLEKTAQIKPNFGLNKLKNRSDSIHEPPEKAVKLKQKKMKPATILNKGLISSKRSSRKVKNDSSKLEHSNSGSSNDTETSTGTVRKVEVKKEH